MATYLLMTGIFVAIGVVAVIAYIGLNTRDKRYAYNRRHRIRHEGKLNDIHKRCIAERDVNPFAAALADELYYYLNYMEKEK